MKVDILILNYNGKSLLAKFLPSVVSAARNSSYDCSVIVVDNQSKDTSVQYVKANFPSVKIIVASKNEVLCSYNEVLPELTSKVVVLLNNDIEVKDDFLDHLIRHFDNEEVFFVAPKILNMDNSFNGGKSFLYFKWGVLKNIVDVSGSDLQGSTHSIAAGAFRRDYFLRLGGFDRLFLPGIWEDVDLCYRALLKGKKGIYEPKSIIWHQESTTFNKELGKRAKLTLAHRNMFLFCWKNICDAELIAQQLFFLPFRLIFALLSGKIEFIIGFLSAITQLPAAFNSRLRQRQKIGNRQLRDRQIVRT